MRTFPLYLFMFLVLSAPVTVVAGPITINFEGIPDSTIVTNQYPGVTFSNAIILTAGISLNEFEFPPFSGSNVASDNGGPMSIGFASPTIAFSGYFTHTVPLTLRAFNSANTQVASIPSIFSDNLALSGDPGSHPNELLQLAFAGGISKVTITGDPAGGSFTLDNATFTSAVPEPGTLLLASFGLGILSLLFTLRRGLFRMRGRARVALSVLAVGVVFRGIAPGQTQLAAAHVVPPSITPNRFFTLTVLIGIPDPNVIPDSVNLIRIPNSGAPVVLGQLHDDGKNGDALAGDTVYTMQLPVTESAVGQIQFQVSAAFRGQLRRVLSPAFKVPITSDANLPPDPGVPGTLTLAGIDSDNDGIRDDVQRYIALTFPDSAKTRAALTAMTIPLQMLVLDSADAQKSISDTIALSHALECSIAIHGPAAAKDLANNLRAQVLNTVSRSQAYVAADAQFSGHVYTLSSSTAQRKALCTFNPDLLPN